MEKQKVDAIIEELSGKLEERKVADRRKASNADQFESTTDRRKKDRRNNKKEGEV